MVILLKPVNLDDVIITCA